MPRRNRDPRARRSLGYIPGLPSQGETASLTYEAMARELVLAGIRPPIILDHPARIVGNLNAARRTNPEETR